MKKLHWVIGLLQLATAPAFAGAWTPEQGESYNKVAYNYFSADQFYGAPSPGFEKFTDRGLLYYGEYGWYDDWAVFGSVPYKDLSRRDNGTTIGNTGFGDVDLGVRHRLLEESFVLSTAALIKLPYLYRDNDPLPRGNGQVDLEWRWLIGKSFGVLGYGGAEVAYRRRFGAPVDEARYLLEYGFDISFSYYIRAKFDGLKGLGNSDITAAAQGNPTLNLEFDQARLDLTAGWQGSREWAWEFTYGLPLYGRNTLRGETIQIALIYSP